VKIYAIHPGASTSTCDVYDGLLGGLRALGHTVVTYKLDVRINRASSWLQFCYEQAKKENPDVVEPSSADGLWQACSDSIAMALWNKPDWVLIVSAMYYPKAFIKLLKRAGLRVALLLTESPYDDEPHYALASCVDLCWMDLCWTNERTSVDRIRVCNPNTYYLAHAYDHTRHCPTNGNGSAPEIASHDVVFVGTGFRERVELLEKVDWSGIDFGLYGTWELVSSRSPLKKYAQEKYLKNDFTAALYRKAKIGLNLHRKSRGFGSDVDRAETSESLNPRAYELAACECFYVSDERAELREIFGDAIPTFKTAKELETLIRYWIEREEERKEMAAKMRQLVSGHTWLERARQVVGDLEQCSSRK